MENAMKFPGEILLVLFPQETKLESLELPSLQKCVCEIFGEI